MHHSRIRQHFTLDEMPEKDEEGSEVAYYGEAHGFDYNATARAAAKGEPAGMKRFFGINDTDGGAAESHAYVFCRVIHLLGDDKLAAFLQDQPLQYKLDVRETLLGGVVLWPFDGELYTERNFPRTTRFLCRKEMVDWPSPDGKYAIAKVFSEARPTHKSKVEKAIVIEKASGKTVTEFTEDDIGTGLNREGKVLWSPDSKRFAHMSGALRAGGEAQTVVYEMKDGSFKRAKLAGVEFPGRAGDAELKGARHLWQYVEPQRWESAEVLVLLHHDYFEGIRADRSIHSIGRTYEVTQHLGKGSATAKVKNFGE
jgi:hypothetical protein